MGDALAEGLQNSAYPEALIILGQRIADALERIATVLENEVEIFNEEGPT